MRYPRLSLACILSLVLASFASPAEVLPKLWGLRPVGGPPGRGDDVGPPIEIQVLRYRESGANVGWTGISWEAALPRDPGAAEPVYDFTLIENSPFFFPDLENIAGIDIACEWAEAGRKTDPERYRRLAAHFVAACVAHCNRLGIRFFHASGNEFNLLARTDWATAYVDRVRIIYPAMKSVSGDNILLAGNLSAGVEEPIQRLYDAGFKDYFDVMDIHCYSNHPRTGVSIEQVIATHRTMARNGDGHKLIYLGEGWGPGRSLPGVVRTDPDAPVSEAEITGMRDFVVNGFRNLNTPKPGFDPAWILGATFFTLNDNMGGTFWRDRAIPIKDRDGTITGYSLDGYRFPDWESLAPGFFNGGIIDFHGNPKGDILEDFPPALPPLSFRGWVLGPDGGTQEAVPEAERLAQRVLVDREITVELLLENTGAQPIRIDDLRLALKVEWAASLAIQPGVQNLVIAPESEGVRLRPAGPVPAGDLTPGGRASRRFLALFPAGFDGRTSTLLGECDHQWNRKEYYADCWIPVTVLPSIAVSLKPERLVVDLSRIETSAWISAINHTDASAEIRVVAESPQDINPSVGRTPWIVGAGEEARRKVSIALGQGLAPGRYPLLFSAAGKTLRMAVDLALDVPRATASVDVDGRLTEWHEAPSVTLESPPQSSDEGGVRGPDDLSARARFLWDETALFVAFEVADDTFWQEYSAMDVWKGDSVQLAFDTRLNALPGSEGYDQDDYEYSLAMTPDGVTAARYHGPLDHGPGLVDSIGLAVDRGDNRTIYEIAIPWSDLAPFEPREDACLGVSLLVNDSDGYGRKHVEWAGGIAAGKYPGSFLPLRLASGMR